MNHKEGNKKLDTHTKISNINPSRKHFGMFHVSCFKFQAARGGFTMVEIVIMLAIIIVISAIVLVSFPNVSGNINLQRSVQNLLLSFRKAQDEALAVREVQGPAGPVIPPAVGVFVSLQAPTAYILFADMDLNRVYNPLTDIIITTVRLERGVRFYQIVDELNQNQNVANITFRVPDASASIFNASATIGESVLFRLRADGALVDRAVRIRTSGDFGTE